MITRNICLVVALLAVWIPSYAAMGATPPARVATSPRNAPPPQRLCLGSDFNGIFELKVLQETPKAEETAWLRTAPHHYLVFNADGTYNYLASAKIITKREELDRKIRETTMGLEHKLVKKYTLEDEGVIKMYIEDRIDYSYRCMYVLKDYGDTKEGDLIFVGYSKTNKELRKVFRHINME
jgi:hypothetical protein